MLMFQSVLPDMWIAPLRLMDIASCGHLSILQWKYSLSKHRPLRTGVDIMRAAARSGHIKIVRLCHDDYVSTHVNGAMRERQPQMAIYRLYAFAMMTMAPPM